MATEKHGRTLALATLLGALSASMPAAAHEGHEAHEAHDAADHEPSTPGSAAIADAATHLDGDHDAATEALYVLQAGGARAAHQLRDAWPRLSLLGQKRAINALLVLAQEHDDALDTLKDAARAEDDDLQDRAFEALRRSDSRGREAFIDLMDDPEVGERAAALLARLSPSLALSPLLDAIAAEGGAARADFRSALTTAVQRADEDPNPKLRRWLESDPAPPAVASVAFGLIGLPAQRDVMTSFVESAAPQSSDFESRWRLLRSSASAGLSPSIDAWVRGQLSGPPEWMLRQAAVEATTARGHRGDVRRSLSDPHPRVRAAAAEALSADPETMVERASLARRDTWPMVRAAAVRSLRTEGEAFPVLVASVDDSMSVVRAAAIEVLSTSSRDDGWDRVHRRLRSREEWPRVTEAAIEYVIAHCRTDAAEALFHVVMRAASPGVLTEDLNNAALAIEALRTLGSPEALAAVERVRNAPGVPPTLELALEEPLRSEGRCQRLSPRKLP